MPLLALAMLAACGDDLESRNAAIAGPNPDGNQLTIERAAPRGEAAAPSIARGSGQGSETEEETTEVDADAESLMDTAQGFAATPIDTAAGFDPTPRQEPAFGTAPVEPETFTD